MKPREVIRALEADGWREVRSTGSHRQLRHPTKPGRVTVPMHAGKDIPLKTLVRIEQQSGLRLRRR
jgi:predicted RNA binding protein YcfA (HicA-like mRNA interferase family)